MVVTCRYTNGTAHREQQRKTIVFTKSGSARQKLVTHRMYFSALPCAELLCCSGCPAQSRQLSPNDDRSHIVAFGGGRSCAALQSPVPLTCSKVRVVRSISYSENKMVKAIMTQQTATYGLFLSPEKTSKNHAQRGRSMHAKLDCILS